MTRHIHAELMIQAANDTRIKWQHSSQGSEWQDCVSQNGPQWHLGFEYRQKPAPHPHQAMMDQAAADPSIEWQILNPTGQVWCDISRPYSHWHATEKYRQKPKMVEMWQWAVQRNDGKIFNSTFFYSSQQEAVDDQYGVVLFRIEGSKISVPMVQS